MEQPVGYSRRWIYATIILCCYGFFKEFKPSEPFLTPYLVETKNFTKDQVNSEVYPFWPYSYLVSVVFVFLLTDFFRYKPVILIESLAYLSTRFLLIWGTSVFAMQMMQVAYGVATATEIAYFSYIYAIVSTVHFKRVTSYVRAIRLLGQSMAGILAQVLLQTGAVGYRELNYFSFASVCIACVFAILLPNVSCNCTNTNNANVGQVQQPDVEPLPYTRKCELWFIGIIRKRWEDFKKFYSVFSLLKWSIWWALAMCGVLQVGNYVQSLWKEIADESGTSYEYNGLVEALTTLCAAAAAFILSFKFMKVNWPVWGELTIGALSLLDSVLLLVASSTTDLWLAYICHILYRTTYAFLITIASTQLAYAVEYDSYALIFGFNTFMALLLQTCLTLVVADENGLDLDIRTQFVVYSGYYYVLTLIFVGAGVYKLSSTGWIQSFRICCHEFIPESWESRESRESRTHSPEPESEEQKLLSDESEKSKKKLSHLV